MRNLGWIGYHLVVGSDERWAGTQVCRASYTTLRSPRRVGVMGHVCWLANYDEE